MPQQFNAIDLYPRSRSPQLDWELFRNPTSEYRGAPFWAWNNRLDRAQLLRQIDYFVEMGMGGFHMHSRTGMATEYLGDQFMEMVRACTQKAQASGLLAWLYDEDRWPSGAAGGLVTRDPRFREKHLRFTPTPHGQSTQARPEDRSLLARYEIRLDRDGRLAGYRRLGDDSPAPSSQVWYAYVETARPSPWHNGHCYVDVLSRPAIERFIQITHERYKQAVGEHFGKTVPAIFTDEPHFARIGHFQRAGELRELTIAWTSDLPETYRQAFGRDILDTLPEIFWELPAGRASPARWRYHEHVVERFAQAFADTIGRWCGENGIAFTGHVNDEQTLKVQTSSVGEAMRHYRSFHIPGVDVLVDNREYNTVKQAQSAARQLGRCGVLSELYGVTNWDFDFVGHKAQGDWQAAMGVTVRVHHLAWVSMNGEAKRDYPASIFYQSPWFRQYRLVEDHFARLNTVLTRGRPIVRVGVIHPIESFWLLWGPLEQTRLKRDDMTDNFLNLTHWLLFAMHDFDFISESLLPGLCPESAAAAKQLPVGTMAYDAVIVPPLITMRSTTLARLQRFADAGGTVIFAGPAPGLVDVEPSDCAQELARRCVNVPFARAAIVQALEPLREVGVSLSDGGPADTVIHQMRQDGDGRNLFLVNTDRARPKDDAQVRIRGEWMPTMLDTLAGQRRDLPARYEDGWTLIEWSFPAHRHLLLALTPGRRQADIRVRSTRWVEVGRLADPVPVMLSAPNVLLLDQACWRINDGAWQSTEEILRIDDVVRRRLDLPLRGGGMAQPWTDQEPAPVLATVELRFELDLGIDLSGARLAMEEAASAALFIDGQRIEARPEGWWVDEAIQTVALPHMAAGTHELVLRFAMTRKTNLEWCYLLGDFGVVVRGRHCRVTSPVRELAFGDWTAQGLPFYVGNVTYGCSIAGDDRPLAVHIPRFKAALLTAALDGRPTGYIAFAPFRLELGRLSAGEHSLQITAYGNCFNAFGHLHNVDPGLWWYGPPAWRSTGANWAYEYQLKPMGILSAPLVEAPAG